MKQMMSCILIVLIATFAWAQNNTLTSMVTSGETPNASDGTDYAITGSVSQPMNGIITRGGDYSMTFGFWGFYQLPPQTPFVTASKGDFPDRIEVSWEFDVLSAAADEGYRVFRDGSEIASLPPETRTYQDFDIYAGQYYHYEVLGINEYGEGVKGGDIGFVNPNGIITGFIKTRNNNPVVDAEVFLTPNLGTSLNFDGLDDYVRTELRDSLEALTIEYWFKGDTLSTAISQKSGDNYIISGQNGQHRISIEPQGIAVGSAATDGEWHHIAFTWQRNQPEGFISYLDGEIIEIRASVDQPLPRIDNPFYLGGQPSVGYMQGNLDEIRVWNRAFGKTDIRRNMTRMMTGDEDHLLAYWKLNEALSDKVFDLTANDNDGRIYNADEDLIWSDDKPPVRASAFTDAQGNYVINGINYGTGTTFTVTPFKEVAIGRALDLDGVNDYVQISFADSLLSQNATWECWVYPNTTADQIFFAQEGYSIRYEGQKIVFQQGENATESSANLLETEVWHHIAVSKSGEAVTIYHNGSNVTANSGTHGELSGNSLTFGKNEGQIGYFNGFADELRIWDYARTEEQIGSTKDIPLTGEEFGLIGYWKLNEGRGVTLVDASELGNTGELINPDSSLAWTDDIPLAETLIHEFDPERRLITLNPSNTAADRVDFVDLSLVPISGFVRHRGTACYADSVEILVNGESANPPIYTNSAGEFIVDLDPGRDYRLSPSYKDFQFLPRFDDTYNLTTPVSGILFENTVKRQIDLTVAGSSCYLPIHPTSGQIVITAETANGCFITQDTLTAGIYKTIRNLPPMNFIITVDHPDPAVDAQFDGVLISMIDSSATHEFIYHAPLSVKMTGFPDPPDTCGATFTGPGGEALPSLPVIEQNTSGRVRLEMGESYANFAGNDESAFCPIKNGTLTFYNNIADAPEESVDFADTNIVYYTFKVGQPNILSGGEHPYQKSLQVVATDTEGRQGSTIQWAYVEGYRRIEGQFTTHLNALPSPLYILRDPPGDESFSYMEQETEYTINKSFSTWRETENGTEILEDLGGIIGLSFGFLAETEAETEFTLAFTDESTYTMTTTDSKEIAISMTFGETFSTYADELLVGEDTDVYIGAGFNFRVGEANHLTFNPDSCKINLDTSIATDSIGIETMYIYSQNHIENQLIPLLTQLRDANEDSAMYYQVQIDRWQSIIDSNATLKQNADYIRSISFDGAAGEYEYTETTVNSRSIAHEVDREESDLNEFEIGAFINDIGGSLTMVSSDVSGESGSLNYWGDWSTHPGENWEVAFDTTETYGFVLHDNDPGDYFWVDVLDDGVYGLVFDLRGGASLCPWEEGTAKRENVSFFADSSAAINILPTEPAVFNLTLGNISETGEDGYYGLVQFPETNPDGALIKINGMPLDGELVYFLPGALDDNTRETTLTIERGPVEYSYSGITLEFHSICEADRGEALGLGSYPIAVAQSFSVNFIQPCTEVSIYEPQNNWLVTPDDGNQLEIRVTDYNTHLPQFTGLKFQYRPLLPLPNRVESGDQEASLRSVDPAERSTGSVSKGQSNVEKSIALAQKGLNRPEELGDLRSNDWINMATVRDNNGNTYTGGIIPKDSLNAGYDIFFWRFTEAEVPDGAYEIRVVSQCTGDAPDGSSAILKGVITRHSPQVFGLPEPADQVLDRGDLISIWFDKPIVCDESQLEPQENIKITDTVTDEVIRPPQLEWTCYENQLILNIPMANNSAYENHVLRAEVGNNFGVNPPTGIQDYYGNVGIWNPVTEQADSVVTWEFLVNRNPVFWDNTVVNAVLYEGEGLTIERELINIGAYAVDFELTSPMLASLGLYISPLSGTLQPGSQQTITMVIPPEVTFGVYENTLTAETALGDEPLNIRLQVLCHEPDFSFDPYQYQYSMGITAVVDIDGTRSTDIYDRVVAFVGDDIRGLGSVQYFPTLPEENRYQVALTVFSSSSSGETVSFHVWDASTCSELGQVLETYTFETDRVFGTPTAPDTLRATNQFVKIIPLHQGWTWFSLNVANDDMSVNTLLNSLTPTSNDEIKSHSSFSRYFGDDDTEWAGSLSSLSNDKMYMIKLAQADTLEVIGYAIDPDTTQINLAAGWNWISYTPAFPLPINNALAPISNAVSGDLIKSQLSYAQYVESLGWIGSLVFMESDFGYRVKVQNAQNFTYPSGQVARFDAPLVEIRTRSAEELPPTWQVDPNRFEASMTITHTLHQDQLEITNQVQAIAAFVDDACRGVAYPSYIPALDETRFFLLVHGDVKSTQAVTFRALTDETLLESPEKVPFMADAMLGTVDLPYRIELNRGKLQVETDIPTHYHLSQNHPNPFNPRTTIRYALPQQSTIDLAIYDVQGKRVATLVNADQPAGYYDVLWEGLDDQQQPVASGIYFYRIHAGDFEQTRQLVLLR